MTIRVTDIETTGVDPAVDAIIEIASVDFCRLPDGSHGIVSEREELVFPGREIPPQSSAVHHIIDADVVASRGIDDVIADYVGADAYVAHNCSFERGFLDRHLGNVPWVCTYRSALRVWPNAPGHSNQVLRYWLGLHTPFGRDRASIAPHRAMSDVIVTAAILSQLLQAASWSDMLQWSLEPPLLSKLGFGKHRGEPLSTVPIDYLNWLSREPGMDEGARFSAQKEIERRTKPA